jgi:hypothetical protein
MQIIFPYLFNASHIYSLKIKPFYYLKLSHKSDFRIYISTFTLSLVPLRDGNGFDFESFSPQLDPNGKSFEFY